MLGYFLRYEDDQLQETLRQFRLGRLERGRLIVEKLATLGIHIEWERVQEIAGDGSVGRPHIALAMVEKGYCKEPREAFPEYLGRNGLAYVERPKMTPQEAVDMLIQHGAVPVLAHPAYLVDMEARLEELKDTGLAGMEVYYAHYQPDTVQHLAQLARPAQAVRFIEDPLLIGRIKTPTYRLFRHFRVTWATCLIIPLLSSIRHVLPPCPLL